MAGISAKAILIACIVCVVGGYILWQNSELSDARDELASLKSAYAKAHLQAISNTLEITKNVLAQRDERYVEIANAGSDAAVSIATAKNEAGTVDADGNLPLSLSDPLIVQYQRVCGCSACGYPAGTNLRTKAPSSAASKTR